MLEPAVVRTLARQLHESERTRVQLEHFSRLYPDMTMADGYAVQREWVKTKVAEGRRIVGHKIGLTSRAMQIASQITEPDYGTLLNDMILHENSDIPTERFILPRVEVELAFMLERPLKGPHVTLFNVLGAVAYVTPALEIIDARIEQICRQTKAPRKAIDTIADNAANAGIVCGGRPVKVDAVDLRWTGAMLLRNGIVEETGLAAGVLNHPATGVVWLANKLAAFDEGLEAGELVLSGSFTRPVTAAKGDTFHADYGALGSIAVHFG